MTYSLRFVLAALAASLAGCGGPGDVAGKVTFNGKLVVSGTVLVLGSDSLPYTSAIDENGDYLVSKVPAGPAKFAVVSPPPGEKPASLLKRTGARIKPDPEPVPRDRWFPLPACYKDVATSGLTFDVRPGENAFDLELTAPAKK